MKRKKRRITFDEFSSDPRFTKIRDTVLGAIYKKTQAQFDEADTPEKYMAAIEEQTRLIDEFWETACGPLPAEAKARIAKVRKDIHRKVMEDMFPGYYQ